jgi:transposase
MLKITEDSLLLVGPAGQLPVPAHDPILAKLAMLYEGECEGSGPMAAAQKFGYSKQRYFQLRHALEKGGTLALQNQKRGPKTNYRRTDQVIQQVVRYRFLDPAASAAVIGQKLRQTGQAVSTRSVERVVAQFGLQKKTPSLPPRPLSRRGPNPAQQVAPKAPARRSRKSPTRRPPTAGR